MVRGRRWWLLILVVLCSTAAVRAHPLVENALDVVISPERIEIEARVSMEEVRLAGGAAAALGTPDESLVEEHGAYVLSHLQVRVNGQAATGRVISSRAPEGGGKLAAYRVEYALAAKPVVVRIDQNFLREYADWGASFVVRIRQSDQREFESALLTRERSVEFGCDWSGSGGSVSGTLERPPTRVRFWPALWAYFVHGVGHIVGPIEGGWKWREAGLDHLLFAAALVLAVRSVTELLLVVTAFTLAHTVTLTLSVLNLVSLSGRVVEPMIAASIVCVAAQNLFWPERSRGRARLFVAFAFGLFHGLGFAGGLKEAMGQMPPSGLVAAMVGFSAGVEVGHQIVVLPLFAVLYGLRRRVSLEARIVRFGSAAICLAGLYFFIRAIR